MSRVTRISDRGSTAGPGAPDEGVEALVDRIRAGDRDALALFLERYGERIRARLRLRLSPSVRRLADSQDMLSTVARRLDRFVKDGRIRASGADELWSLVMTTAHNAILEKHRLVRRLQRVEGPDASWARPLISSLRDEPGAAPLDPLIGQALDALSSDTDRAILSRWLAGHTLASSGASLGLTPEATRQRWRSMRLTLRDTLRQWSSP